MAPVKVAPSDDFRGTDAERRRPKALIVLVLAPLSLAGCDYFPRDPDHSLQEIRTRGTIRVGAQLDLPPEAMQLVKRLEQATGAKAQYREGPLEPLLQKLDTGQIDLVLAPFTKETPWATSSALSPPFRTEGRDKHVIEWRAATRSGENRWIFMVETNARKISRGGGGV
ncbi:hypothetical protein [Sphingopyxis panaciterrae]